MSALEFSGVMRRYFALLYVVLFCMIALFWPEVSIQGEVGWAYAIAATTAYAGLYVFVAMLPWMLLSLLPRGLRFRHTLLSGAAVLGGSLVLLAVYADYRLYVLYQYHFNGFVWNLLTTPGGIAALGATASTERTIAMQVIGIVLANAAVMWGLHRYRLHGWQLGARPAAVAGVLLFGVFAGEEAVFAYSIYTGQEEVLAAADTIPFHLRSSNRPLLKKLGVENRALKSLRLAGGEVAYPGTEVDSSGLRPTNVIILVAESFRWDLLDPEITPNLWRFSERATRYEKHYSGGNRTRLGMFSLFYGIYAPYWYSFEEQRVAPVLMDVLRKHNYQFVARTSQSFDYPELRHTLFAGVDRANMHEINTGEAWQRDIDNIDAFVGNIDARDSKRPFFGFMFFESTHAPYSFPEDRALRSDYLKDMNYVKLDLRDNIRGIHNRYVNAAHHIDAQVGRLIDHLEKTGMLDQTVLLFTGDHGEEFMEKGRWGHGHGTTFPEEQIRVPLVLWRPGVAPSVVTHRTSHLQVASTLLSTLGVSQAPRSYSSADPLEHEMPYFVFGEYNHMGIDDGQHKITFPFTGVDYFRYAVYDENDHPVTRAERDAVVAGAAGLIEEVTKESRRFVR